MRARRYEPTMAGSVAVGKGTTCETITPVPAGTEFPRQCFTAHEGDGHKDGG